MKLKDGHTYVTRSGVKRKVYSRYSVSECYPFGCASLSGLGGEDIFTATGRYVHGGKPCKWDLVKEYKRAK